MLQHMRHKWHLEPVTADENLRRYWDGPHAKFGNVFRLRSGRYGARYTRQGVLHRAPETFDTEEAARDWLRMQRAGV